MYTYTYIHIYTCTQIHTVLCPLCFASSLPCAVPPVLCCAPCLVPPVLCPLCCGPSVVPPVPCPLCCGRREELNAVLEEQEAVLEALYQEMLDASDY